MAIKSRRKKKQTRQAFWTRNSSIFWPHVWEIGSEARAKTSYASSKAFLELEAGLDFRQHGLGSIPSTCCLHIVVDRSFWGKNATRAWNYKPSSAHLLIDEIKKRYADTIANWIPPHLVSRNPEQSTTTYATYN
ncbi:hypothetical protein ACLOJK_024885 [Asimina triloba]